MIKFFNLLVVAIFSLLVIRETCYANNKINVSLIELSGALENPNSGWAAILNKEVLSRVEKKSAYTFVVKSYPGKRAANMLRDKNVSLIFPTVLGSLQDKTNSIYYYPESLDSKKLMVSVYVVYTLNSKPTLNSLSELKGKKIGFINGANLPNEFEKAGVLLDGANTLKQNFLKLSSGRVDGVLTLKVLGENFLSEEKNMAFTPGQPLLSVFGGYSAQDNPEGRELIKLINSAIESMIKDGTYKQIMKNSGSAAY